MDSKLDEALVRMAPTLYSGRYQSPTETAMCWGFECGNGWYRLLAELSLDLEDLILMEPADTWKHMHAQQVKEKYGSLRFSMWGATDEMLELIDNAEERSLRICESCGENGKLFDDGWCEVRCDHCYMEERRGREE